MSEARPALVVVGTPIGNLSDLSPRAAEALARADVIACEDTRRTGRLLSHLGISGPRLVRVDDHTERAEAQHLIDRARAGQVVVLVSDAGLPGLSDPGARVIAAAAEADVIVEVIPGPFAGAVAAVASALLDPSGRFVFEGFLPRKGAERRDRIDALVDERRTTVLYEAPHRIERTVEDLAEALGGDRRIALCRELTKMHEEVWRGSLAEALGHVAEFEPRGEYVVVVEGAPAPDDATDETLVAALEAALASGLSRRDAAASVAAAHGVAANRTKRLVNAIEA
ncbi:MAG: 16S rRNA (cytidine(1402)-2'-O)-methyltransferase [Acidimicrobiales bacterium]